LHIQLNLFSFYSNQDSVDAISNHTDILETALEAQDACEMMEETIDNALDAARARLPTDGELVSIEIAGLISSVCEKFKGRHHSEVTAFK